MEGPPVGPQGPLMMRVWMRKIGDKTAPSTPFSCPREEVFLGLLLSGSHHPRQGEVRGVGGGRGSPGSRTRQKGEKFLGHGLCNLGDSGSRPAGRSDNAVQKGPALLLELSEAAAKGSAERGY